eukprot:s2777_g2.t1
MEDTCDRQWSYPFSILFNSFPSFSILFLGRSSTCDPWFPVIPAVRGPRPPRRVGGAARGSATPLRGEVENSWRKNENRDGQWSPRGLGKERTMDRSLRLVMDRN